MMTIPSFHHVVQGLEVTSEVLRGTSPIDSTTTALYGPTCPSPPLLAATALTYLAAGRSVVPIAPGCKAPSVVDPRSGRSRLIRWERYQVEPAIPAEVQRWFTGPQPMGIGIVAGPVSGVTLPDGRRARLEFLDFDDADVHACFVARLAARGVRFLLEGLPCEETPRGGRHYGYLCVEWAASTTLARRPVGTARDGREQMVTLIESRGQGGQCVVAPTPAGIHPDHPARGYTMVRGTWTQIPLITPAARRVLWACARALNEAPPRHANHPIPALPRVPTHGRSVYVTPVTPLISQEGKQVRAYAFTCSPSVKQMVRGPEGLRLLFQRPDLALACAAVLGVPTDRVGHGFLCILPGHEEAHPSASLHWDSKTGALQYRDWHARSGVQWYTLPDVRASLAYGRAVRLRGPSVATWQLRLLIQAGLLAPYAVPARPLPSAVRFTVRQVYEGFLFLLGCKWWHTPQAPTPFSWRFAAAWCGLSERHVGEAMQWLLAHGWLRQVGQHRQMALFLPG
jgi:Bifunctional DNA primase/polymerase, N-terminal